MAKLHHPERGTEIDVDDDAVDALVGEGWEKPGESSKKRSTSKKDSD